MSIEAIPVVSGSLPFGIVGAAYVRRSHLRLESMDPARRPEREQPAG